VFPTGKIHQLMLYREIMDDFRNRMEHKKNMWVKCRDFSGKYNGAYTSSYD
jgi:hypothetical protein